MVSALVGLVITMTLVFGSIGIGGGSAQIFVFFPLLIIVVGIALGLSLISCGVRDLLSAVSPLRVLVSMPSDGTSLRRSAQVHRYLISYLYAGGAFGSLIGFIQMANNLSDMTDILPGLSRIALTLFYAVFLSECFFRPAAHKIESAIKTFN